MKRRCRTTGVHVTVAFAADACGRGVAYANVRGSNGAEIVRTPFTVRAALGLGGRDVAYAALGATLERLAAMHLRGIRLAVDDAEIVADVRDRRTLPGALTMPYVRLRCALNRLHVAEFGIADPEIARDLAARARAESTFLTAA